MRMKPINNPIFLVHADKNNVLHWVRRRGIATFLDKNTSEDEGELLQKLKRKDNEYFDFLVLC